MRTRAFSWGATVGFSAVKTCKPTAHDLQDVQPWFSNQKDIFRYGTEGCPGVPGSVPSNLEVERFEQKFSNPATGRIVRWNSGWMALILTFWQCLFFMMRRANKKCRSTGGGGWVVTKKNVGNAQRWDNTWERLELLRWATGHCWPSRKVRGSNALEGLQKGGRRGSSTRRTFHLFHNLFFAGQLWAETYLYLIRPTLDWNLKGLVGTVETSTKSKNWRLWHNGMRGSTYCVYL